MYRATSPERFVAGHRVPRVPRGAFTLVELLVVISIIGVLVSLLLPAINASREAARKIQCINNIRQLGLAITNYESVHRHLPVAGLVGPRPSGCGFSTPCFNPRTGPQISWVALVLPFMEEQALHDQIDLGKEIFDQRGDPQAAVIEMMRCPTDSTRNRVFQHEELTQGKPFAKSNYAAYCSPVHATHQEHLPGAFGGFLSGTKAGQRLRQVRDGLSKTIALAEVRVRDHEWDPRGAWRCPGWGLRCCHSMFITITTAGVRISTSPRSDTIVRWNRRYSRAAQLPNRVDGLNDRIYLCPDSAAAIRAGMPCGTASYLAASPRSQHLGGVNATTLDGRAFFLSDDIDYIVMAYLISTNDRSATRLEDD